MFGKMYTVWSVKTIYLSSLALFEVGSIIAATAQTSNALIGGRALSGIGAVGLTVGGLNILTLLAEPKLQNVIMGVASASMGISVSITGIFLSLPHTRIFVLNRGFQNGKISEVLKTY